MQFSKKDIYSKYTVLRYNIPDFIADTIRTAIKLQILCSASSLIKWGRTPEGRQDSSHIHCCIPSTGHIVSAPQILAE